MNVLVTQKGAREHFLAARAFHRVGWLSMLVVDWYSPFSGRLAGALEKATSGAVSRAFRAQAADLPREKISALYGTRISSQMRSWFSRNRNPGEAFLGGDRDFARAVSRLKLPEHDVFFGYSYASLEALQVAHSAGKLCILDQIDPGEKEHEIICEEQKRWPGYIGSPMQVCRPYFERLKQEWRLADVIIVNSEWSRDCNIAKGAPPQKIEVVPLAYEPNIAAVPVRRTGNGPCQILWMGRVTLQKGIQYLVEAARLMENDPVEFVVCGDIAITQRAMAAAPANIRWLGKVSHARKTALYNSASAFVLPTVSDGFALTQLEALAHGLPVIITPNCGKVVEDGVTGFIVPSRAPQALAEAVMRFVRHRDLSSEMSPKCRESAAVFSVDAYGQHLVTIIEKQMKQRTHCSM
jgi:hypothetical protein